MVIIDRDGLDTLITCLRDDGFDVIGPTKRSDAIVYDSIVSTADLPEGWTEEREAGHYRVKRRDDSALFGFTVGPDSWKRFLFPSRETTLVAEKTDNGFVFHRPEEDRNRKRAFLGVRSCDLHAIAVQDRVFQPEAVHDPGYVERRRNALVIAVQCIHADATCFCASMDAGPTSDSGFDLALTELIDADGHRFLLESGSGAGRELVQRLSHREAVEADISLARRRWDRARGQMGRHMETDGLKQLLARNLESPRWNDVADRCLSCGNCTLACPTCFCSTEEDVVSIDGQSSERNRHWASCFEVDFSYMVGGSVRSSTKSRYRQWMTHKLSTWHDQFGTSGCIGCGRCIAWCPVGIDITEEADAIRRLDAGEVIPASGKPS